MWKSIKFSWKNVFSCCSGKFQFSFFQFLNGKIMMKNRRQEMCFFAMGEKRGIKDDCGSQICKFYSVKEGFLSFSVFLSIKSVPSTIQSPLWSQIRFERQVFSMNHLYQSFPTISALTIIIFINLRLCPLII